MPPGITGLSQLAFCDERRILDPERPVEDYVSRILPQKVALDQAVRGPAEPVRSTCASSTGPWRRSSAGARSLSIAIRAR